MDEYNEILLSKLFEIKCWICNELSIVKQLKHILL